MPTTAINPAKFLALAKQLYKTGSGVDARSQYLDVSLTPNVTRDYQDLAEVKAYLANSNSTIQDLLRSGGFPILVNVGGTLNSDGTFTGGIRTEYWFQNGVVDSDLVAKSSGGSSIANTDSLAEGSTNMYFTPKRSLDNTLIVSRLEFIQGSSASATYTNAALVGKQLTYLSIEGVPIGTLARSSTYMAFNSTTGTVTLTNSMFQPDDYVLILYRGAPVYLRDGSGNLILDGSGNPQIIN